MVVLVHNKAKIQQQSIMDHDEHKAKSLKASNIVLNFDSMTDYAPV